MLMSVTVSLQDLVDELESVSHSRSAYLNIRTGEIVSLSEDELSAAEDEDELTDYPDWQQEAIIKAHEVMSSDDYLSLPTKFDIHEWQIMEKFSRSREDPEEQRELLFRIRGSGAFRMFRDAVYRMGIEKQWSSFRDAELARIAVEWLEENGISYRRDLRGEERRTEQGIKADRR